ncbi:MAG: Ig-like domain-containing protein [Bacteroidales bacterium]|nr:Ig-like domain-containing protein [Bacteroidales bacterium]
MKTPITKTLMAIALTAMATFFAGCGPDEPDSPNNQTPPTPTTVAVTGVSLNKSSMTLTEGGSETLTATVAPSNATNTGVSWSSSNTGVATVNGGQVTAVKAGTATITVTTSDGGKTATCSVTVEAKKVAVTGVKFDIEALELIEGETGTIKVTVEPADATDQKVNWTSSNPEVVTVADGVVTAVAPGTATIIATTSDGGKTVTCNVTINPKPIPVEGVSVEVEAVEIAEGETTKIVVTITPDDATVKDVTFSSSDEAVATVDEEGNITAVGPGTATITITTADGGKTATCEVTVNPKVVPVEGIAFTKDQVSVIEGEKVLLYVSFTPKNASDKRVTWSSSDTGVATIDTKGNVTGVKPGTATITVKTTDGGKTATCVVNVTKKPTPVSAVTINRTAITLIVDGAADLVATVSPEDATNKKVTWSSSDEAVAKVDQNGEVTGVKPGTAKITVTTADGGKTATCDVTVTDKPVSATGVTLDKKSLSLMDGQTSQLIATVSPTNATNHEVTWSSSSTSVATVDKSGKVTAVAPGTATITVKTHNGKTATCSITVSTRYTVYSLATNKEITENSSLSYTVRIEEENYYDFAVYDKLNKQYASTTSSMTCSSSNSCVDVERTYVSSSSVSKRYGWRVFPKTNGTANITLSYGGMTRKFKVTSTRASYELRYGYSDNSSSFYTFTNNEIILCPTKVMSYQSKYADEIYVWLYNTTDKKPVKAKGYTITASNSFCTNVGVESSGKYTWALSNAPGKVTVTVKYSSQSMSWSESRSFTVYNIHFLSLSSSATSYNGKLTYDTTVGKNVYLFYWHNSRGTLDYTEAFDGDKTNAGYQITEGSGKAEVNIYKISGRYLEIEIVPKKAGTFKFYPKYNDNHGTNPAMSTYTINIK